MKKILFILSALLYSCQDSPNSPLENALKSEHPAVQQVMQDLEKYEVQIIYTQIDSAANGTVTFTDYSFQLDASNYFYPASTIKLPVAVMAMERVTASKGVLSLDSRYRINIDSTEHSIGDDIRQIFAVSDNDAYNRLYEFLGRDYCNQGLMKKGLSPVRISHRVATAGSDFAVRDTLYFENADPFYGTDSDISPLAIKKLQKGSGFIQNDSLIKSSMDFSYKNFFPLQTQHDLMKRIFFEVNFSQTEQFQLSPNLKKELMNAMCVLPRNAGYDGTEYYDSYVKFFIFGDSKEPIPSHIKIYNKVGYAYGTLTETAYITDELENIQFLLSATILVNENGIFNDDHYEYTSIGLPFLAQLGREIYAIELARKIGK